MSIRYSEATKRAMVREVLRTVFKPEVKEAAERYAISEVLSLYWVEAAVDGARCPCPECSGKKPAEPVDLTPRQPDSLNAYLTDRARRLAERFGEPVKFTEPEPEPEPAPKRHAPILGSTMRALRRGGWTPSLLEEP